MCTCSGVSRYVGGKSINAVHQDSTPFSKSTTYVCPSFLLSPITQLLVQAQAWV